MTLVFIMVSLVVVVFFRNIIKEIVSGAHDETKDAR